ncbi:hypothetical protein RFI_24043, partial [Reticulomyxa filosa]
TYMYIYNNKVWSYYQIVEEIEGPLQSITNPEIGPVTCLAICHNRLFASCQTKDIHIWQCPKNYFQRQSSHGSKVANSGGRSHAHAHAHAQAQSQPFAVNYLGKMCGHMSVITVLKAYGNVLISASKDGIVQIWSVSNLQRLSMLLYPGSVLDLTIFPNPLPLCHVSMYQHYQSLVGRTGTSNGSTLPFSEHSQDTNRLFGHNDDIQHFSPQFNTHGSPRTSLLTEENRHPQMSSEDKDSNMTDINPYGGGGGGIDILADKMPQDAQGYGLIRDMPNQSSERNLLDNQPDFLLQNTENVKKERQLLLSGELTSTVLPHLQFDIDQLRLIIGGDNGEIHVWHVVDWTREKVLRGHGDKVTCLDAFGNRLVSGYANGNIKVIYFCFILFCVVMLNFLVSLFVC